MDIENLKEFFAGITLKESKQAMSELHRRLDQIIVELVSALPKELQDKYGNWDAVSNLVYNGGCEFWIFEDVGLDISPATKKEWFQKARILLQPVLDAWQPFGIKLEKINFLQANDGLIIAHLVVK
ncbi:MAG: hypothetical protein WCT08_03145 [Patescibacteria group bacterium]|jgi:hypothetical protein